MEDGGKTTTAAENEMRIPGEKLGSLQAGRALAAVMVLIHHAVASTTEFTHGVPTPITWLASFGYLGVDYFFVLSGFIIVFVHGDDGAADLPRYAYARFSRIYLPYLPIGLSLAAFYVVFPSLSASRRAWTWLATITLLPSTGQSALIVAWTLTYEIVFYLIFGMGILIKRPVVIVLVWSIIAISYNVLAGAPGATSEPFLSLMALEFLFGALAARLVRRPGSTVAPSIAAAVTLLAFVMLGHGPSLRPVFGLAMAFVVIGVVRAEMSGVLQVPGWLVFLGAASYSIYLVHNPVAALAARLSSHWEVALGLGLLSGLGGGLVYHVAFERSVMRFARKFAPRARHPTR